MDDERLKEAGAAIIGKNFWLESAIFVLLKKLCTGRFWICMRQARTIILNRLNLLHNVMHMSDYVEWLDRTSHNFKQLKPNKNAKQIVLYLI